MELDKPIVITKNDYYTITVDQSKNRGYLTLKGYWGSPSDIPNYISDVQASIQKLSKGFTLLVDLTQYNGTSAELYHVHIESLKLAVSAGLSRAAEVFSKNPLLKVLFDTYSKESGANTMAFQDDTQAEKWLDLY